MDGLVSALGAAGADLAVACQRADEERYGRLVPNARVVAGPPAIAHRPARLAWEQSGLPLVAQQVEAAVIHSPHYSMPLRPNTPVVVTVHDLTFFTEPDAHSPVIATFYKAAIRTSARRATRLIVPSKATRDELVRVLAADPTRIDVAYHGVDHDLFHRPDEQQRRQVSDRLGLHGKGYVAYLGTLEPRKNVPALITGWAAAVADLPDPPALVLAGRQRLERGGRRGGRRGACPPAPGPARLPALQRPARILRRSRRSSRSRAPARASACLRWRPWPAAPRC